MPHDERLFLLDGMALAYRAYYAFINRPLINSKGVNTSAIYGFVTALVRILDEEKPDHIAVVFDTKEPTFRHKKFPAYKATRQKMPEDMSSQLDTLKEVVRAFNVPSIELPGYEADDIIGTLARHAEKEGVLTYMVTGDKDYMQLISSRVKMYKPGKAGGEVEVVDAEGVRQKFGVEPAQVIDVLGLIGDSSDNVPGVPGIGPKTAMPLIQKYGSIPQLYERLDEIPQKGVREKLAANRDKAFLSRELVTIHTTVPLSIDFHQLRAAQADARKLIRLFDELEFKGLASRVRNLEQLTFDSRPEGTTPVLSREEPVHSQDQLADSMSDDHHYHCVNDLQSLRQLCRDAVHAEVIALRTEKTPENALAARLVGVSLCLKEREAFYIPVRLTRKQGDELPFDATSPHRADRPASALDCDQVLEELRPMLENPAVGKVGHNIKDDMLVLGGHGIDMRGVAFDTMVASYILRADGQHNLAALAREHLHYRVMEYEDLAGKGKSQRHITELSPEELTRFSGQNADMTMRLFPKQRAALQEKKLQELCEKVEFPLIAVLTRMESTGICLDINYLKAMSKELERTLDGLVADIHHLAGEKFNINSTQQLGEILFTRLGLRTVRKTKTGFSTDVNVLDELQGEHPIIDKLLEYRQITKLKSTYVDALPELVHADTGRLHTSFNQTVAATGRLSSSDPNLQNIPIRTELGRAIRKAFIPEKSSSALMSADYSQIELRVMAHISGDRGLLDAFRNKEDIHASTAAKVFGVPLPDVTPSMRRKAKEVNFGIMYGIGPFGLARRLGISQQEARQIITTYFERFPAVKEYIAGTIASVRESGYVRTLLERRRYLPDISSRNQNVRGNAERQAINMPIQGTAADMIKLAMIAIDQAVMKDSLKSRMLLQVHDELVFEVPRQEISVMQDIVKDKMQNALRLDVPVDVEIGIGENWLEAH